MDKPTHVLRAAYHTCGPHSKMPASSQGVPDTWGKLANKQLKEDRLQEMEIFSKLSLFLL